MRRLSHAATFRVLMSFPANKPLGMIGALALGAAVLPWTATAQGVPIVDPKSIIQHGLEIAQMSYLTGGRELEADKKRRIDELHQDQLDVLDATLAMMTGPTPWIGDLEVIPGAEAEVLYAVEDNNPYADRFFGDAKTSIEEMIVATAQKYAGHPGCQRQSKSEPKGSAKCCHFGVARLPVSLRQHPGDRAYHRAGGRPDALAREGQLLTMCVWVKPCLGGPCSGPSDSFRRSSQGCSRGGSGGPAAHRLVVLIRRFRSIRRRAGCW